MRPPSQPTHLIRHVQGVIANTTQTLIVLDPDGFALTRTWVLYEAWASLAATGGDRAGKLAVLAHGVTATPLLREVYASMEIHRCASHLVSHMKQELAVHHMPSMRVYELCSQQQLLTGTCPMWASIPEAYH
jgi:hypothetical protein